MYRLHVWGMIRTSTKLRQCSGGSGGRRRAALLAPPPPPPPPPAALPPLRATERYMRRYAESFPCAGLLTTASSFKGRMHESSKSNLYHGLVGERNSRTVRLSERVITPPTHPPTNHPSKRPTDPSPLPPAAAEPRAALRRRRRRHAGARVERPWGEGVVAEVDRVGLPVVAEVLRPLLQEEVHGACFRGGGVVVVSGLLWRGRQGVEEVGGGRACSKHAYTHTLSQVEQKTHRSAPGRGFPRA